MSYTTSTFTQKVPADMPITAQLIREQIIKPMKERAMCHKLDKHSVNENLRRVGTWMERMGIKYIGGGFFSRVYAHPTDPTKAIKWGPLSDGWLVYAAWAEAQRGTANPHLPVIHSIKRYEQHGTYCAVMERLEATVCQARHKAMNEGRYKDADCMLGFNQCSAMLANGSGFVHMGDWEAFLTQINATGALTRTLERLHAFATRHGLSRDLHDENAMLRRRPDGGFDLVITDPFSFNNGNKEAALAAAQQATCVPA